MKKHKLDSFFSTYPLYKNFKVIEGYDGKDIEYTNPSGFRGETFSFFCKKEEKETTFEVGLADCDSTFWKKNSGSILEELFDIEHRLDYAQHLICRCKSCNTYKIDLLVRVWTLKPMPINIQQAQINASLPTKDGKVKSFTEEDFQWDIYIEKIGIGPDQEISINKEVLKYLDRESGNWYYKGNRALVANFGIGAFSYFRRIVEKELVKIVYDLSKLPSSESDKINALIAEYEKSKKVYPLYDNVFHYLPYSLKALGENPIALLYKQTSEGLHNMSDEDCLKIAEVVNQVLIFVIKKINEERSEILEIREALKKLKGGGN